MKKTGIFLLLVIVALQAKAQDYVITDFGVTADSTQLNTHTIQHIIDSASENGGGTIVIPKGVFLTGALFFKPNTSLRLMKGAKLKGSDNINDYPLGPSRMEGHNLYYYAALINAYYVDHFSITGPGTIDGNGLKFWKAFWAHRDSAEKAGVKWTNLEVHRPRLLFLWGCKDVTIKNVQLHNSGFWTTHLYQCDQVLIDSCDIRSPYSPVPAPSTDGIDIDVCEHIRISNCYISVDDDGVAIKGGKGPEAQELPGDGAIEDVLIENCSFGRVNAALTFGSECIHAKNIAIRNCKVDNNRPILLFKMRPDTYQIYEDITVDHITGKCGTLVMMSPWTQFFDMHGKKEKPYGILRNVTISNINVQCNEVGKMKGNPNDQVSNIMLKNVHVHAKKPVFTTPYKTVEFNNVTANGQPVKVE